MSYLRYLCLLAHSGVQNILRCVFVVFLWLVYTMLPFVLYSYSYLITPLVFSNVYLTIF